MMYAYFIPFNISLQWKEKETFKDISERFAVKMGRNISHFDFIFSGKKIVRNNVVFTQIVNKID